MLRRSEFMVAYQNICISCNRRMKIYWLLVRLYELFIWMERCYCSVQSTMHLHIHECICDASNYLMCIIESLVLGRNNHLRSVFVCCISMSVCPLFVLNRNNAMRPCLAWNQPIIEPNFHFCPMQMMYFHNPRNSATVSDATDKTN